MKSKILLTLGLLSASLGIFAQEISRPSKLKKNSADRMEALADDNPHIGEALLPEKNRGTVIALAAVNEKTTKMGTVWIKKLLNPEWLPRDWESKMIARKDVVLRESSKRGPSNRPEWKGDYFVLSYEIAGHRFHVLESGRSVSVRIDFPQEIAILSDPRDQFQKWLGKFCAAPDPSLAVRRLGLVRTDSIFSMSRGDFPTINADGSLVQVDAWDFVKIVSDGQFLYVSISEIETGPFSMPATVGLPKRF